MMLHSRATYMLYGLGLLLSLCIPFGATYFSASCISSRAHAGLLLWEFFSRNGSTGSCGSAMLWSSWSFGVVSSIFVSWTLVASRSSISSVGSFLALDYAESSSNVTSLLMLIFLNLGK